MEAAFDVIPMVSIHPNKINLYSEVYWHKSRPPREKAQHLISHDKKHNGKVSVHAKRKVNKAVDYLLFMANDKFLPDTAHGRNYRFKIAFITLTLPAHQVHSDNVIKSECLNQFLVEARRYWQVKNYIWRAEKQRNGNIHFHILVDKFIPWSELRDRWNRICNKLGYVDRYRTQMRQFHDGDFKARRDLLQSWSYKQQVKAYQKGKANDWNSPNSTDVHSLYKVNQIASYILKYIGKDEKHGVINGRMWGCNFELSHIKGGQTVADNRVSDEIQIILTCRRSKKYVGEYFTVIHIDIQKLPELGCTELFKLFSKYMFESYNYDVQTKFSNSS